MENDPKCRRLLSRFHTLSDTPFYALRDTFEQYYPETLILYTTRPKNDWIRSMIKHQMAGGEFLANLYGIQRYPYTEADSCELERVYDEHHAKVCKGLPSIDISVDDDSAKWELLCSALPRPTQCLKRSKGIPWPHENGSPLECNGTEA